MKKTLIILILILSLTSHVHATSKKELPVKQAVVRMMEDCTLVDIVNKDTTTTYDIIKRFINGDVEVQTTNTKAKIYILTDDESGEAFFIHEKSSSQRMDLSQYYNLIIN